MIFQGQGIFKHFKAAVSHNDNLYMAIKIIYVFVNKRSPHLVGENNYVLVRKLLFLHW